MHLASRYILAPKELSNALASIQFILDAVDERIWMLHGWSSQGDVKNESNLISVIFGGTNYSLGAPDAIYLNDVAFGMVIVALLWSWLHLILQIA
jgi:hypothetical protein